MNKNKFLSILASLSIIALPTSLITSCSKSNSSYNTVDASVSEDGDTVSFVTTLSLPSTVDFNDLNKDYSIYKDTKKDGLTGFKINAKLVDDKDAAKFDSSKPSQTITTKFIISFSLNGLYKEETTKTYNWIFAKTKIDDKGNQIIDEVITGFKFTIPRTVIFYDAKFDEKSKDIIKISGANFDLISKNATWNLTSDDEQIPQDERIKSIDISNNSAVINLSKKLDIITGNYFIKCQDKNFYTSVSFSMQDNKFFSYARINYFTFGDTNGTLLEVRGKGVKSISDPQNFKLSSDNGNVPDDLTITWAPHSALTPDKMPEDSKLLLLSEPIREPDTYTLSYGSHEVKFIIPSITPKMYTPIISDDYKQVSIRGENLQVIANNSYNLSLRAQDGSTVPNDETLQIDKTSEDNNLVINLSSPLNDGNYYFEYQTEDFNSIPSGVFEVKGNKPVKPNLENAQLIRASMPYGQMIEITTKNLPDGDYTKDVKVNGDTPLAANENGDLLEIGIQSNISSGTKVKVELKVSDTKTISIEFVAAY